MLNYFLLHFFDVILYMGVGLALLFAFVRIYTWITPHDEFALIKEGNLSAIIATLGSLIGAALPLSALIHVSAGILDMIVWGVGILVIQFIVYMLMFGWLKHHPVDPADAPENRCSALFVAGISVVVGLISMGCFH